RARPGAKQVYRGPGSAYRLDHRDQQWHVLAGVELAGIHRDQLAGGEAEAGFEPGPVAPRRLEQFPVETAPQRHAAVAAVEPGIRRPGIAAERQGDLFEMPGQ